MSFLGLYDDAVNVVDAVPTYVCLGFPTVASQGSHGSLLLTVSLWLGSFSGYRSDLGLHGWTRNIRQETPLGVTSSNEKREFVSKNPGFFFFYEATLNLCSGNTIG